MLPDGLKTDPPPGEGHGVSYAAGQLMDARRAELNGHGGWGADEDDEDVEQGQQVRRSLFCGDYLLAVSRAVVPCYAVLGWRGLTTPAKQGDLVVHFLAAALASVFVVASGDFFEESSSGIKVLLPEQEKTKVASPSQPAFPDFRNKDTSYCRMED